MENIVDIIKERSLRYLQPAVKMDDTRLHQQTVNSNQQELHDEWTATKDTIQRDKNTGHRLR